MISIISISLLFKVMKIQMYKNSNMINEINRIDLIHKDQSITPRKKMMVQGIKLHAMGKRNR